MANNAKIFVIIVTYKGHQWYERCFTSLRNSEIPVQTVVIDNASNDGTVEYIREQFPEIHLIESQENLGFGRANNLGMRYALDNGCDYVFLLNQDTWIETNSIKELVRIHQEYPEYGVLSPMHVTADKKSLYIQIEDGKTDHANRLLSDCYFQTLQEIYPFEYINAAAWLMTKKTLETVGGFDPIFVHYAEDDNYLNRMKYHGIKLGLSPKVTIVHDHQKTVNPFEKKDLSIRANQSLLQQLTDINKNITVNSYLIYLLRKMIFAIVTFKLNTYRTLSHQYKFLSQRNTLIQLSRKENMKKQPSWL